MNKAVIEDASLEMLELFESVSKEAKKEKLAVPPISKMVYYWTRKPLIVGRAVALASTLDSVDAVKSLLGIYGEKRVYTHTPNLDMYKQKLGKDPSKIKVLDPFAGTGNLMFPATELGLNVTCSEYNPLAHLIEKASLKIPAKNGHELALEFQKIANQIIDETEKELKDCYTAGYLAYLWVWCITCPHCTQRVPLSNQMYVAKKRNIGVRFTPTKNKNFTVKIIRDMDEIEGKSFTQKGGKAQCISCGNTISYDVMTKDITKNKDLEMIAIQIQKPRGRDYIPPTKEDKKQHRDAIKCFKIKYDKKERFLLIPNEEILSSHRREHTLWHYGIRYWNEYFSDRQLLILSTLVKKINAFCTSSNISNIDDLRIYLSFLVARLVDSYSYGVHWNISRETPEPTLAMRQPRVIFNFIEINPFEKVRGSLRNNVVNITKAIEFCSHLNNSALCNLESVTKQSNTKYDLIITDPPYGDDVQYGELSEFFYLWVYRILKNNFILPSRAPLEEDFCESWGRFGNKKIASQFFEAGLKKSFVSMNKKLKDDGLLVVFFAHSSIQAWNQLLASIRESRFRVVSSYAIHTESTENILARGKTSFMSSIIVVCKKITKESEEFFEDIIPQVEDNIKKMINDIPDNKLLTLPITDLLIMVYGKVLESCTKHTVLKSRRKDFTPDFETLISDARSFIMRQLVTKLTHKSMNAVGSRMAFYILTKIFHKGVIGGDDALKIAQTYGIDLALLEKDQVITKNGKIQRLCYLSETERDYPSDNVDKNNLHQQLCYLSRLVTTKKADSIRTVLGKENFREDHIKQIVFLILKSFALRRNKGESLNVREQEEIETLKVLADIMNIRPEEGLDAYF